ncbi:MAG: NAD-dependent epimerase/dehydratase family protein [Chloroflexi bacterium]|nr:NAD-dependent epimerase/dehydratase family protein [Chloroflexota bacterium]
MIAEESRPGAPGGVALVTGATGMIGGRIARMLLQRGDRVRVLVRPVAGLNSKSAAQASGSAAAELEKLGAEIFHGDVTDPTATAHAVDGCVDVYHCAAIVDPFHRDLAEFDRVNVGGTRNVLEAALAAGARRLLHVSSIAAVGAESGTRADEFTVPKRAFSRGYAMSKSTSEGLVRAASNRIKTVSINPSVVFGPEDRHFVRLIRAFLRGSVPFLVFPDRPMPLVYVDDVARAGIAAIEYGKSGERYIVAAPPIAVREFITELADASGRRAPRWTIPDWLAIAGASSMWVYRPILRRRVPISFRGLLHGPAVYDGSRAERELGVVYTPMPMAIAETVGDLLRDS